MNGDVLIDAGPLVVLIDRSDDCTCAAGVPLKISAPRFSRFGPRWPKPVISLNRSCVDRRL
jgi:hypothetical protein